ncbi:MAG: hypothetical protein WC876_04100 [Candidatus Thermoplasmatota archaeon]|jgi:Flp pilus assembly protein TadB
MTHEGPRGRRRSTLLGVSLVLGVVAIMVAITAYFTGEPKVLIVAIVLAAVAVVLSAQRRTSKGPKEPT